MTAPDVEKILVRWVADTFAVRVGTERPGTLETVLPFVQVERMGGGSARFTDSPRVDVDVYAATYGAAQTLAAQIHDAFLFLRGPVLPTGVVKNTRCDSGPSRRPETNPAVRRVGATYTLTIRPGPSA